MKTQNMTQEQHTLRLKVWKQVQRLSRGSRLPKVQSEGKMVCAKEKVENVYKAMKAGEGLEAEIKAVGKKYHEAAAPEMINFSYGLPYERKVSEFLSEHWSILIF